MVQVKQVPAADWENWIVENQGVLLDVREADEWELGMLPNSTKLAMSEIQARVDELPRNQPILCICRSGTRSQQVAVYLAANGYNASNMAGGMKALGLQD